MGAQRWIAEALETGAFSRFPMARATARIYGAVAAARLTKTIALPPGALVVGIGGAHLGGSGKTVLAGVVADFSAKLGAKVVVVGHGYGSPAVRAGAPRVVRPEDHLVDVGDEARLLARTVASGVTVVVGPREAAIRFAVDRLEADVVVVDGLLQTSPARLALSLLAVPSPSWREGQAPPAGDLRAAPAALARACDHVVTIGAAKGVGGLSVSLRDRFDEPLGERRPGLLTALARPERVVLRLRTAGIAIGPVLSAPDHGPVPPRLLRRAGAIRGVDVWLATSKCIQHFPPSIAGIPVRPIGLEASPSAELTSLLRGRLGASRPGRYRDGADVAYEAP